MYKYQFIDVKLSIWNGKPKDNIEDIIDEQAAVGWRLVTAYTMSASGTTRVVKLIFEKEVDEDYYKRRSMNPSLDDSDFV